MSWIDKEIKRRAKATQPAVTLPAPKPDGPEIAGLWQRLERANEALPEPIRLTLQHEAPRSWPVDGPRILAWLRAPNDAGLGLAADGIRYAWPVSGQHRSNNFWIHWDEGRKRYFVLQRVSHTPATPPAVYRLDERCVDLMIKYMVLGRRITTRAVRKKRLGLF